MFSTKCPKCGSDNVTKTVINIKNANGLVKGRVRLGQKNCEYRCHECGYKWKDTCIDIGGEIEF